MFEELETVVLTKDIQNHSLKKGDIGTVVHIYHNKKIFEVEFVDASGETIAVLTLTENDIRSMDKREILHAREFASA